MKLKGKRLFLAIVSLFLLVSCRYSFSDYSIDAQTAKVNYFENLAPIQNATLAQEFTNKLETAILRDTPLTLVNSNPEVEFSGAIIGYSIRPESISGSEQTAKTRLTVSVNVEYVNTIVTERSFQQTFQASAIYDSNQDLSSVEELLLVDITDQLVQAIFNKAFSNW